MKLLIPILLAASLSGCKLSTIEPEDSGRVAIYNGISKRELFDATAKVMNERLTVTEQDSTKGVIRGEKRQFIPTWGEIVAAYVNDMPDGGIELKVVSKKRIAWQFLKRNWDRHIHKFVTERLQSTE